MHGTGVDRERERAGRGAVRGIFIAKLLAGLAASSCSYAFAATAPFSLTSTTFKDGARLQRKHAGNIAANPNCAGQNISPQLAWSNAPAGTKSFVFFMIDPEGRFGGGVTHWVAYGVPVGKTSFAENEIARSPAGFVGGKSTQGLDHYMGPCTPPGTSDHHYIFIAIATDLEPDALPAGLTREDVIPRLAGHAKASAGLVGRFRHP
jgi:Raf kinase inhibitor-like YbhB/YbcL family protein